MKKIFTLLAVAAMAFASNAQTLTVADGLYMHTAIPICGLYADTEGTLAQTIYPAELLTEMEGKQITKMTFYTVAYYFIAQGETDDDETDYINFEGAKLQLSLKEVTEQGFDEDAPAALTGATAVATLVPEVGDYMMTFELDEPFEYNGGNLLVEVSVIESGTWGQTYFFGDADESEAVNYSYFYYLDVYDGSTYEDVSGFMPRLTFEYEAPEVEQEYYVAGFNDWENPIKIGPEGATVEVQAQNFDDPQDTAQEFKIVTTDATGATLWYGGIDEGGVGYFMLGSDLMNVNITLNDEGANFRLAEPGNYTIKIVKDEAVTPGGKAPVEGITMVVSKGTVTAIETINSDVKGDNTYYNLMGQKFNGNNLPAGIYIHNGKKIIVR